MLESYDNFLGHKVLAVFRCGSSIYGLNQENSDNDLTVILDGYNSRDVIKEDGIDYFVFGKETYKDLLALNIPGASYSKIWIDNVTLIKDNLLYLDSEYKQEFEKVINVNWNLIFKKWLELNICYFKARLYPDCLNKSLYHIYRLHSIVELYEKEGKFLSHFNKEDFDLALDFKSNESNRKSHYLRMKKILDELEDKL